MSLFGFLQIYTTRPDIQIFAAGKCWHVNFVARPHNGFCSNLRRSRTWKSRSLPLISHSNAKHSRKLKTLSKISEACASLRLDDFLRFQAYFKVCFKVGLYLWKFVKATLYKLSLIRPKLSVEFKKVPFNGLTEHVSKHPKGPFILVPWPLIQKEGSKFIHRNF